MRVNESNGLGEFGDALGLHRAMNRRRGLALRVTGCTTGKSPAIMRSDLKFRVYASAKNLDVEVPRANACTT